MSTTPSNPIKPLKTYTLETSSEIFQNVFKDILKRTGKAELPTGIDTLDEMIWGVHKKELLVVGARPSHGKSSLLINMAWHLAKLGKAVTFLSLEMSRYSILERIACIEYGLHGWNLRRGVISEIEKLKSIESKFQSQIITAPFFVLDQFGKTIQEVEKILQELKPEILFIDHAQKVLSKGFGNKYEALSDFVNRLQDLAVQYDCAIVLASQINRQGAKESSMDFMKGSGDIEESADTLITCKWLIKDNPSHMNATDYEITVQKQRHGPTDQIMINFDGATYKMSDKITHNNRAIFGMKEIP